MYYVVYFWSDNGGRLGISAKILNAKPLTSDKIVSMQAAIRASDRHDIITIINIVRIEE